MREKYRPALREQEAAASASPRSAAFRRLVAEDGHKVGHSEKSDKRGALKEEKTRALNQHKTPDVAGAGRGNRTPTGRLAPADFKSAASANFAIPARVYSSLGMPLNESLIGGMQAARLAARGHRGIARGRGRPLLVQHFAELFRRERPAIEQL